MRREKLEIKFIIKVVNFLTIRGHDWIKNAVKTAAV